MARKNRIISTMEHRIRWLSEWLAMRNYNIRDERKVFLCIIYNTAKAYLVDEAAQEKTLQINYSFTLPFSREKIQKHIFGSIDKRKSVLKYDNETIKKLQEQCGRMSKWASEIEANAEDKISELEAENAKLRGKIVKLVENYV